MKEKSNNIGIHPEGLEAIIASDSQHFVEYIFYKKYGQYPCKLTFEGLDKKALKKHIEERFVSHKNQVLVSEEVKQDGQHLLSFVADIQDECILHVPTYNYSGDGNMLKVLYSSNTSQATLKKVKDIVDQCAEDTSKNNLFLLSKEDYGMDFKPFEIQKLDIDLNTHYNDDFIEVDQLIKTKLNQKGEKGIVLLHGEPGTGKTSYIRHLISSIDKKMIYIPASMSDSLTDPHLIQMLSKNPDSILIIEDAESVLIDRKSQKNNAISNLLNIADGLLSDCLNIQLICTFNVHISKIDNALLRKGRIIASYEMKKLSMEKTSNLLKEKYDSFAYESLNLAQIYNYNTPDFDKVESKIGFGV